MKNKKPAKLSSVEQALIYIAGMMEDSMHGQYKIRDKILDILGLEEEKKHGKQI